MVSQEDQSGWKAGNAFKLPPGDGDIRFLDCGGAEHIEQMACMMNAACKKGSNCIVVQRWLDGEAVLVIRVVGVLIPGSSKRRHVRPGEELVCADAVSAEGIHLLCLFCRTQAEAERLKAQAAMAAASKGEGPRNRQVVVVEDVPPGPSGDCCTQCFCRKKKKKEGGGVKRKGGGGGKGTGGGAGLPADCV